VLGSAGGARVLLGCAGLSLALHRLPPAAAPLTLSIRLIPSQVAKPDEVLLVVDAMTGQEAANLVKSFNDDIGITGAVLTKMDGDTRGGAALTIREISGRPIKFTGVGEKMEALVRVFCFPCLPFMHSSGKGVRVTSHTPHDTGESTPHVAVPVAPYTMAAADARRIEIEDASLHLQMRADQGFESLRHGPMCREDGRLLRMRKSDWYSCDWVAFSCDFGQVERARLLLGLSHTSDRRRWQSPLRA